MTQADPNQTTPPLAYRRVLLKLSGEALLGSQEHGIDADLLKDIADHLKEVVGLGVQLGIVIGGGNIFRGVEGVKIGIDRATGDNMGMLATVINALALMCALERTGLPVRVQSAIEMRQVAEPFILRRALRHLEQGRVVIFAAGTGNPYFSTDTAAALRSLQIGADALLMAKNRVDGVYDADPHRVPTARKFDELDYDRLAELAVMDGTAATLAKGQSLPIIVFDFAMMDNLKRIVLGDKVGTLVRRIEHVRGDG